MNFKQKLTTGLATGTALVTIASTAAFASTVTVSGNGFSSTNVMVMESNNTVVAQNNTQVVTNVVTSSANTGGNGAAFNMGGTSMQTGPATSVVRNVTTGNGNAAQVGCGCDSTPSVTKVNGNFFSSTNVGVVKVKNTFVGQNNTQVVNNGVFSSVNTGMNGSLFNMGASKFVTGPAGSSVTNVVNGSVNEVMTP